MSLADRFVDKYQQGVTLIELLLVISLMLIIGSASTPFLSRFVTQNAFDITTSQLEAYLRQAQASSFFGTGANQWGVCYLENTSKILRLYESNCLNPEYFQDYVLPQSVSMSGFSDVVFSDRGEPQAVQTITISTSLESRVFSVNEAGGISRL